MEFIEAVFNCNISKIEQMIQHEGLTVRRFSHKVCLEDSEIVYNASSLLCKAAELGHLSVIRLFLKNGVNVDARDSHGRTPLHNSAMQGHTHVMEYLFANNADINSRHTQGGNTPLHLSAAAGQTKAVELLLRQPGINCTVRNKNGDRAVECSAFNHIRQMIQSRILGVPIDPMFTAQESNYQRPAENSSNALLLPEFETVKRAWNKSIDEDIAKIESKIEANNEITSELNSRKTDKQQIIDEIATKRDTLRNELRLVEEEFEMNQVEMTSIDDELDSKRKENSVLQFELDDLKRTKSKLDVKTNDDEAFAAAEPSAETQTKEPGTPGGVSEDTLECPYCMEVPLPPRQVFQCVNGHILCSVCKAQPTMTSCPQCRLPFRNNYVRNLLVETIIAEKYKLKTPWK